MQVEVYVIPLAMLLRAGSDIKRVKGSPNLNVQNPTPEISNCTPTPNQGTQALNNLGQCADLSKDPVRTVQITTEPEPLCRRERGM